MPGLSVNRALDFYDAWEDAKALSDQGRLTLTTLPTGAWGVEGWIRYPVEKVREVGKTEIEALRNFVNVRMGYKQV